MRNRLVFITDTVEEVYQASYALLKYLEGCNLKPPAGQGVTVYTRQPALLETYGSFFPKFDLRELPPAPLSGEGSRLALIEECGREEEGGVLYLGGATYPVTDLGPLFRNMERGTVYLGRQSGRSPSEQPLAFLGLFSPAREPLRQRLSGVTENNTGGMLRDYADLGEFRKLLREFFTRNQEESVPNLVKRIHPIDAGQIREHKRQYLRLPLPVRFLRKMTGRAWNIERYFSRI